MSDIITQVIAGVIVLLISTTVNWALNKKWTKDNIINLIKRDPSLQRYLRNISLALNNRKILILREPGASEKIQSIFNDLDIFNQAKIHVGTHEDIDRIDSHDLTIVSIDILEQAEDREGTFNRIIARSSSRSGLIIFAPMGKSLTKEEFSRAGSNSRMSVAQTTGRLPSDALSILSLLPQD